MHLLSVSSCRKHAGITTLSYRVGAEVLELGSAKHLRAYKEEKFKENLGLSFLNQTKDWALVQNVASAGGVKVELGLFRLRYQT